MLHSRKWRGVCAAWTMAAAIFPAAGAAANIGYKGKIRQEPENSITQVVPNQGQKTCFFSGNQGSLTDVSGAETSWSVESDGVTHVGRSDIRLAYQITPHENIGIEDFYPGDARAENFISDKSNQEMLVNLAKIMVLDCRQMLGIYVPFGVAVPPDMGAKMERFKNLPDTTVVPSP